MLPSSSIFFLLLLFFIFISTFIYLSFIFLGSSGSQCIKYFHTSAQDYWAGRCCGRGEVLCFLLYSLMELHCIFCHLLHTAHIHTHIHNTYTHTHTHTHTHRQSVSHHAVAQSPRHSLLTFSYVHLRSQNTITTEVDSHSQEHLAAQVTEGLARITKAPVTIWKLGIAISRNLGMQLPGGPY